MSACALENSEPLRLRLLGLALIVFSALSATHPAYRQLATHGATATVSAVRPLCEQVTCAWGWCGERRRVSCDEAAQIEASQSRNPQGWAHPTATILRAWEANLTISQSDGSQWTTWAPCQSLGVVRPNVGDNLEIHYLDVGSRKVVPKPNPTLTVMALAILLVATLIALSAVRGSLRRASALHDDVPASRQPESAKQRLG